MACEARRGCGYRKVGGLYMVGGGFGVPCDRLPFELSVCPCCGAGIKQTRGWTWVDVAALAGGNHVITGSAGCKPCGCFSGCPLCHNVKGMGKAGLLWVGAQFYPTIEHFEAEAKALGVSRRITAVPKNFEMGKTWILFAHPRGIIKAVDDLKAAYVPAIFRVWKPERLERIFKESDRNSEAVAADVKRGITPVFVSDNDKDHQGSVYDRGESEGPADVMPTQPLFEEGK